MRTLSACVLSSIGLVAACGQGAGITAPVDARVAGRDAATLPADQGPSDHAPSTDGGGLDRTGTLWAHSATELYKIDPSTWHALDVGSFGVSDQMTDLAVTPDGRVYTISPNALYLVDPGTAKAAYVMAVTGTENVALTFLPDGTLLAADKPGAVKRIDPVAKTLTVIGSYGGGYETAGDLVAVSDGTMYGISDTGACGVDASANNVLLKVDTSTGMATPVGPIGFGQVWGLAYYNYAVLAFTGDGKIIQIDRTTGAGTLLSSTPGLSFWGAGVSPLVKAIP